LFSPSSKDTDGETAGSDRRARSQQLRRLRRRVAVLEREVTQQQTDPRIEQLEDEIQELRALSARVAELADLVTEVLAVNARQDPELKRVLAKYLDGI